MSEIIETNDQSRLDRARGVRDKIITELTEVPFRELDKNEQIALLAVLDSSDKSVYNKAKLKVKDDANKNDSDMNAMITQAFMRLNVNSALKREMPIELNDDITITDMVEDEDYIGVQTLIYEDFIK